MPTTVVGLYRTEADVKRMTDDLSNNGFGRGEINLHDEASADLRSWLVEQGVPDHDAEDYILGVRNGGKLVTLEASDDRAGEAVEIVKRHERATAASDAATGATAREGASHDRDVATRAAAARTDRTGDDRIEVVEEELDVGKRARVVEEVVLSKDVEEHTETVRDTVRRTDVDVERTDDVLRAGRDRYQAHHRETLGRSEHAYGEHEPAVRYGFEDARSRGQP